MAGNSTARSALSDVLQTRQRVVERLRGGELPVVVAGDEGITAWLARDWGRKAGLDFSKSAGLRAAWANRRRVFVDRSGKDVNVFRRPLIPATAWLLGLIVGDGCVARHQGRVTGLQLCGDLDVCRKAAFILKTQSKIKHLKGGCYGFECGSVSLARSLVDIGINPAKTYTVPWPACVPRELDSHFMRGFWDADGCVTSGKVPWGRRLVLTSVSCSLGLMTEVHRRVAEVCASRGKLTTIRQAGRAAKYMVSVSAYKAVTLGDWLWTGADESIRGARKYETFQYWRGIMEARRKEVAEWQALHAAR